MSTQGRRGSRSRRTSQTSIERAPLAPEPIIPDTPAPASDTQLLDDTAVAIAPGHGRPLARSLAGAFAGTVLVVGLAFGAALGPGGAFGPTGDARNATGDTAAANGDSAAGHGAKDAQDGDPGDGNPGEGGGEHDGKGDDWTDPESTKPDGETDGDEPGDDGEPTDKPTDDPGDKPAPDATKKPEPDRTPKPAEKPDPADDPDGPISLALGIKEYHPKVEWGSCEGLDFDYYKVVRSKDSSVSWPAGENDAVIAAVGQDGYRKAYDKDAPHGVKVWYRVFCVRKGEDGYKVVNASATKGIEVPEEPAPPTPDPISLELDFTVNGEGKVVLTWSACDVDGFGFYKVVKSTSNDDPSYFPWTEGTQVIGVVESLHATEWYDWAPDAGHTAFYRVQCLGYIGDDKVLLGESDVVTVTTTEA